MLGGNKKIILPFSRVEECHTAEEDTESAYDENVRIREASSWAGLCPKSDVVPKLCADDSFCSTSRDHGIHTERLQWQEFRA